MSNDAEFKSPLDKDIAEHGNRYGFLVHFVREALEHAMVKHMPAAPPYFHNGGGREFDESCIRCSLEKAIEHANRPGWKGLEWTGRIES